eukprot:18664-Eustigmatos_ZCMA.PRE.1
MDGWQGLICRGARARRTVKPGRVTVTELLHEYAPVPEAASLLPGEAGQQAFDDCWSCSEKHGRHGRRKGDTQHQLLSQLHRSVAIAVP